MDGDIYGAVMRYKKYFNQFIKELDAKMKKGFIAYGDDSFERSNKDLIEEIKAELLDICGWSIILYSKLYELERKIQKSKYNSY